MEASSGAGERGVPPVLPKAHFCWTKGVGDCVGSWVCTQRKGEVPSGSQGAGEFTPATHCPEETSAEWGDLGSPGVRFLGD